jgi:hypothetical protein
MVIAESDTKLPSQVISTGQQCVEFSEKIAPGAIYFVKNGVSKVLWN